MTAKLKATAFKAARIKAEDSLRASGERVTLARINVYACLLAHETACTHEGLLESLRGRGLSLDRVTAYRALEWLVDRAFVHRISSDARSWRFAAQSGEEQEHAHFVCRTCDSIYCLKGKLSKPPVRVPRGFKVEQRALTLEGVCKSCAA